MSLSASLTDYIGSKAPGLLNMVGNVRMALSEMDNPACDSSHKGATSINSAGVPQVCNGSNLVTMAGPNVAGDYGTCQAGSSGRNGATAFDLNLGLNGGSWSCLIQGSVAASSNDGGVEARIAAPCAGPWVTVAVPGATSGSTAADSHSHGVSGSVAPAGGNHKHTFSGGNNSKTGNVGLRHFHTLDDNNGATRGGWRSSGPFATKGGGKIKPAHYHVLGPSNNLQTTDELGSHSHTVPDTDSTNIDHSHGSGSLGTTAASHSHGAGSLASAGQAGVMLGIMCNANGGDHARIEFRSDQSSTTARCNAASITAICTRTG